MHGDSVKGASLPTASVVGREPSAGLLRCGHCCGSPAVMTVLAAFDWVATRMGRASISHFSRVGTGDGAEWGVAAAVTVTRPDAVGAPRAWDSTWLRTWAPV